MDFVPEKGFYQPSNDETWESYQALLCVIEQQLGGYPRTVVCGVADEILGIFRNRYLNQVRKRFEVEKLIGVVSIDVFNQLVLSTNEINDYNRATKEEETLNRRQEKEEEEEEEGYLYQPRSSETWRAYNALQNAIVQSCGLQPQLVLYCVANELIEVLKNEEIKEEDLKKRLIGDILNLGFVSDQLVLELVAIVGLITDYKPGESVGPTDVIREDSLLLMMMGVETTDQAVMKKEEDQEKSSEVIWQSSSPLQWTSDEEEEEEEEDEDDTMVEDENVGPIVIDDLMVKNENVGLVDYSDDDDLVMVVNYNVMKREFVEKLVLDDKEDESTNIEVKKEEEQEEDEWVVV